MPKIGLSLLTHNNEATLEKCLVSVLGHHLVNAISVVDMGSHDQTVKILERLSRKHDVPLFVQAGKNEDYALERNRTLAYLRKRSSDYLLWLNPDESLVWKNCYKHSDFEQKIGKSDISNLSIHDGDMLNRQARVFRLQDDLQWAGKCHEFILSPNSTKQFVFPETDMVVHTLAKPNPKDLYEVLDRLHWKENLLLHQLQLQPNEPRWYFSLAETYRAMALPEKDMLAIEFYEKRLKFDTGNIEERYLAALYSAIMLDKAKRFDDNKFHRCGKLLDRPEHNYHLSMHYRRDRDIEAAYKYSVKCKHHFGTVPEQFTSQLDKSLYLFWMPWHNLLNGIMLWKSHMEMKESIDALKYAYRHNLVPESQLAELKKRDGIEGYKICK